MQFFESVEGYIATECPVCGTRMIFRPHQAGQTLTCEMCYHRLTLPKEIEVRKKPKVDHAHIEPYALRDEEPPPAPVREEPPAANLPRGILDEPVLPAPEGPRSGGYQVKPSEEDHAPRERATPPPSHRAAPAPEPSSDHSEPEERTSRRRKEAFAVTCPQCGNRMYARLYQVGQQIACGACGHVLTVPEPPAGPAGTAKAKPQPILLTPQKSPAVDQPAEARPPAEKPPQEPTIPRRDEGLNRALGAPMEYLLPDAPKWTFFSGVVSFLWVGAGPLFWVILTVGALGVSFIFGEMARAYMAGGLQLMVVVIWLIFFGIVIVLTGPFAASCFLAVIHETANGVMDIVDWPEETIGERLVSMWHVAYQVLLSASIAFAAGQVAAIWMGPQVIGKFTVVGAFLLFPFLMISSLESQRTIWPFSAVVIGSLFRLWWGWLLMYAELAVLLAGWGAAVVFTYKSSPYLTVLWSSPILAAIALIAARLFGRLIWLATVQDYDGSERPTVYERVVRTREEESS